MSELLTDRTFGAYDPSQDYAHHVGAYLVTLQDGMVAVIKHPSGFLLPGGDIEGEETHEECLLRHCLEEIAYDVRVDELITSADAWETSPTGAPLHSVQYYYSGELLDRYAECGQGGATLCYVPVERIDELLAHPMQCFAVRAHLLRETSAAALSFIDGHHHILDGPLSS